MTRPERAAELPDHDRLRRAAPPRAPSSCSPTHRIGRRPASTARVSLPADRLVRLAGVAPPLGVADDRPTSRGPRASARATSPVYAPASSWWTFCAPTATRHPRGSAASASRTAARQTNGGHSTRVTPRLAGPRARSSAASSPASAGVVCIFQLPATMIGRIGRIIASASRSIRSRARWTAERCIASRSASSPRVASGVSRRAAATARTVGDSPARRPSSLSDGRSPRADGPRRRPSAGGSPTPR